MNEKRKKQKIKIKKRKISAKGQYGSPTVLKGGVPLQNDQKQSGKVPHYKYNETSTSSDSTKPPPHVPRVTKSPRFFCTYIYTYILCIYFAGITQTPLYLLCFYSVLFFV